jgi:hypothetical protein
MAAYADALKSRGVADAESDEELPPGLRAFSAARLGVVTPARVARADGAGPSATPGTPAVRDEVDVLTQDIMILERCVFACV